MPLSGLWLTDVTALHLQGLIENEVREARRIDYKAAVGTNDEAHREFLADVSSFANASGGDLLIGVVATDGVASALVGIQNGDVDADVLRLENMIRDGLEPRVPGIEAQPVSVGDATSVLVLRVPRSWAAPHMVTFKNLSRFFSRNSAGKYQLDVSELRSAFVGAENARQRLLNLRQERIARIVADEVVPTPTEGGKLVLHLFPFSALEPDAQVDTVGLIRSHSNRLRPLYFTGGSRRITFDGALMSAESGAEDEAVGYTLVFRSGVIESVDTALLRPREGGIPSLTFEEELIKGLAQNLALAQDLGVGLPIAVAVSVLNVRGRRLGVDGRYLDRPRPFDRNDLLPPEFLLETFEVDAATVLRPTFDSIWNAGGWAASIYYREDGTWGED